MQVIDRDHIVCSHAHGELMLHRLVSGAYQFGTGDEAKTVTSLDEVKDFPADIQDQVSAWLEAGGVHAAKKDKRARLIAEQAERQSAGLLDSLVASAGGEELKGQIIELVTNFLKANGTLPEKPVQQVQQLDHGSIVMDAEGNREFVPNDVEMDEAIRRELEADELEAVGVGDDAESGDMADEVNHQKRPKRKR